MSGVATAIIGSAVIGAGVGIYASRQSADAQSEAAAQAAGVTRDATEKSVAETARQFDTSRADMAPWRTAGGNALAQLVAKMNAGPGDYTKSPGYEFRLSEGNKAVERSAAARGNVLGAGTLKALSRYNEDYATSDYDNFLRRYYESLTPLQSLSGVGQSTASQTASLGAQAAGNIANTTMAGAQGVGNALLTRGQANASGAINAANSIAGAANSGVNNFLMWRYAPKPKQEESLFGFDKGWNLE